MHGQKGRGLDGGRLRRLSRTPYFFQGAPRRRRELGDLLRRSLSDEPSPVDSRPGAEVDDPVGAPDQIEIVLDDEDRVSLVDELLQNGDEPRDVVEVEPRRRFVEDVDRLSRSGADQFFCELDPLRLASRKSRRGLAESQIIESHMGEKFQFFPNRGDILKQNKSVFDVGI